MSYFRRRLRNRHMILLIDMGIEAYNLNRDRTVSKYKVCRMNEEQNDCFRKKIRQYKPDRL